MNTLANNRSHIMLVDDTRQNLKHLENMLEEEGYLISTFLDGSMALKAVAKKPPDLILLDINRPGLNAYEQINQIFTSNEMLVETQHATILAFSKLAEVRDDETGQHIERTRVFCRILTEQLRIQLSEQRPYE